ncbi:MAG: undecaprenyl-phosphate glucose phosphotransferase [Candidatus Parcubacteria bacterium]|nr:undecaprenyl-phosphate glucose phosphotransferase [Burkholderiales bacterium]
MPDRAVPVTFRQSTRLTIGRGHLLYVIELLLEPLTLVLSLWAVAFAIEGRLGPQDVILSLIVFSLTFPGPSRLAMPFWRLLRYIVLGWAAIGGLLYLFGYASRYIEHFDPDLVRTWLWVAPLSLIGAHLVLRAAAPAIRSFQGEAKRVAIVGMNEQGIELARRLVDDRYSNVRLHGFFDDRAPARLQNLEEFPALGKLLDLPAYARNNKLDVIYLSLPMASQSRVLALLDALRDTTSSIYFVPDTFVTDLIQGRMDTVGGIPVVAVCETPFTGLDGAFKRGSDVMLSVLFLVLLLPVLAIVALAVKLTSPGPVIFRQRRYGLDGHEIVVYKFRSMTVQDDGDQVRQASKRDARVTRVGAFLRRTSLDELPQFINVLQGRMSIVGPRPHAVAHNEMYRKLIKGYMLRHKVRPGVTGWAQVNGYRGETETLEKMKARIDCDLEYLRNWSLRLDLFIIAKTIWVVLKNDNAY